MKLFISKQVFKETENGVKIEPLDENRTQLTIYHTVEKENFKEITPFTFKLPINFEKIKENEGNIFLNFEEVRVNKNEEEFKKGEEEQIIYALLSYKETGKSGELCIPSEEKDRCKLIYTLWLKDGITRFYFIKVKLLPMQLLTTYLLFEQGETLPYKYLVFKRNKEDKIEVEDLYTDAKNVSQFIPLSKLGGLEI